MSGAAGMRRFGEGSACPWKASRAKGRGLLFAALAFAIFFARADACKEESVDDLAELGKVYNGTVANSSAMSGDCNYWRLTMETIYDGNCSIASAGSTSYLLFEFWRLNREGAAEVNRSPGRVLLLATRGVQPNVSANFDIVPPPTSYPELGENGTYLDAASVEYGRPHQRLVVPLNATRTGDLQSWFVTVANLQRRNVSYSLRVSCLPVAPQPVAPCPRPSPAADECWGPERGRCGDPPKGALASEKLKPSLNRVCYCVGDWGDVDCSTRAPRINTSDTIARASLAPGEWAFWQLSVPAPSSRADIASGRPSLLVEMNRAGGGFTSAEQLYGGGGAGGDPFLIVMPKQFDEANRLPSAYDFGTTTSDVVSVRLLQNLHYVLLRNLTETLPAVPPPSSGDLAGGKTYEFYVAVYNNDGFVSTNTTRFPANQRLLKANASVSIRVRWTTAAASGALCPGDCYGRGRCSDPSSAASVSPMVTMGSIPPPADFTCTCQQDFGGPLCEGNVRSLTLTTSGEGSSGSLAPGQWAFHVLHLDPARFSTDRDDLNVFWNVRDADPASTASPATYYNALFTANLRAYPRLPLALEGALYERGMLISYNWLFQEDGQWKPMQLVGGKLKAGANYVLGLYNSDYVREATYNYTMTVSVPAERRTWLHPYMSVVLGVTASIILCLVITLCRRVLQRYGWGPFRPRTDELGPDGLPLARVQVAQMRPRNRGVPPHIIDSFHSYEYRATRAEKEQLAKSRPEPQQPPPPQSQSQPAGPGGNGAAAGATGVEMSQLGGTAAVAASGGNQLLTPAEAAAAAPSGSRASAGGGGAASGSAACGSGGSLSENDEPQCAVCLCEYEGGESITQLPCKHEFHGACIRKWLQTHYTCPICRVSLLPDTTEPDPHAATEPGQAPPPQLQQVQQQAPPPPTAPPAPGEQLATPPAVVPPPVAFNNVVGGAVTVLLPRDDEEEEPAAVARPGLFARIISSMRVGDGSPPRQIGRGSRSVSPAPLETLQPPPQQQQQSQRQQDQALQVRPSETRASSAGTSSLPPTLSEPIPAELGPSGRCADRTSAGGQMLVAAPPPPGSPQLLARGPSAGLESLVRQRSGASTSSATTCPYRLAAGRVSAAAVPLVPLDSDGSGADMGFTMAVAPAPWPRPRDSAALPPQMVDEQPPSPPLGEPQSQSQSQSLSYTVSGGGGGGSGGGGSRARMPGGSLSVMAP